jgi:hypothetical protein
VLNKGYNVDVISLALAIGDAIEDYHYCNYCDISLVLAQKNKLLQY